MDMNKAFFAKKETQKSEWKLVDAQGETLGRLATKIADALRGKDKPVYTPHADTGDYIVVINAEKIVLTGNKWEGKEYASYSGWMGGLKTINAQNLMKKHPTQLIENAVKGMLPKNKLNRQVIKKLKVYAGSDHPHAAQFNQK
jgi:large subunit ribosomal protein L13